MNLRYVSSSQPPPSGGQFICIRTALSLPIPRQIDTHLTNCQGTRKKSGPIMCKYTGMLLTGGSRNISSPNKKGKRQSCDSPGFYTV